MGRRFRFGLLLSLSLVASAGCGRTFKNSVTQPNPLTQPLDTLRISEEVVIVTGDKDLSQPRTDMGSATTLWVDERVPLQNKASFTVVSRDRLRFHVQIEHKWQEWARVTTWDADLVDDQGRHYRPEDIDLVSDKHVVKVWDYEQRTVVRNDYGDIVQVNNDGYKSRQPLGSLSMFRGRGDFVFYHRDLFTPKIRSLTLRLTRPGLAYQWTWRFADDGGDGIETAMR